MKTILISLLLISSAQAACNITLYTKTIGAKTSYTLEGDSISKKVIEKLSSQCAFDIKAMSATQKKAMQIKTLRRRLAKLQKK